MIQFEAAGKRFRRSSPHRGLKDRLLRWREPAAGWTEALAGLTLRVGAGEAVAIVGRNGSGKSTALALAAGVLRPSRGRVVTRGRVSPLLALGAGVHPDLTGRENVQLNGVLLGLTRREVRQRFDAIHAFSELGPDIDQPVRHYSSGMLARLGFSVATHLDPQVLIVDEVLAVGDAAFQAKCLDRIRATRALGVTILYVSHDTASVLELCDRAVYLKQGRPVVEGRPRDVCRRYYADQGLELDVLIPPGPASS